MIVLYVIKKEGALTLLNLTLVKAMRRMMQVVEKIQ
jgi:hypothetical protein